MKSIKEQILGFAKESEEERNKNIDALLDCIAEDISYYAKTWIEDDLYDEGEDAFRRVINSNGIALKEDFRKRLETEIRKSLTE